MSSAPSDTRTRILAATLELLEESDGARLRMSDIARRADISRQALYLHFASRTELFIEATHYLDALKQNGERLQPTLAAQTGLGKLEVFISGWAAFVPEIYPYVRTLMVMSHTDAEAREAWEERLQDARKACVMVVTALEQDGALSEAFTPEAAADLLWTLLQISNWERLTQQCGWTTEQYKTRMLAAARHMLMEG